MVKNEFTKILTEQISNWMKTKESESYKWTKFIRFTPEIFELVCKLSVDKDVTEQQKAKLAPVMSYFISPLDIIPEEFWGAMGYVDDIALAAKVLKTIIPELPEELVQKYWRADENLQELMEQIDLYGEEMVGNPYYKDLLKLIE